MDDAPMYGNCANSDDTLDAIDNKPDDYFVSDYPDTVLEESREFWDEYDRLLLIDMGIYDEFET
jgi:hypothetical protein